MHGSDTRLTTIYCHSNAVITFTYSNNIEIKNLMIENCGYLYLELKHWTTSPSSLLLKRCSDVEMQSCAFRCDHQQCGLAILDPIGYLVARSIWSGQLLLIHSNTTSDVNINVFYYEQIGCCINDSAIIIFIDQHLHKVNVYLYHITLSLYKPICIHSFTCKGHGQNFIAIRKLILIGAKFSHYIIHVTLDDCKLKRAKEFIP